MEKLLLYRELADNEVGVSFLGRLGTYRYMNMDQAIGEAMDFAHVVIEAVHAGQPLTSLANGRP